MHIFQRKVVLIGIITIFLFFGLYGCSTIGHKNNAIVLPALFYHEKDRETMSVQVGHINCKDGTIQYFGETVYEATMDPFIRKTFEPSAWDGNRIVISKHAQIAIEPETQKNFYFIDPDRRIQYGKDCYVETIFDPKGNTEKFVITTINGSSVTIVPWQNENTVIGNHEEVALVQCEKDKINLVFLEQSAPSESTPPEERDYIFHVATYSLTENKLDTHKYVLPESAEVFANNMPSSANSGIIGNNYYFRDKCAFSSLDLKNGSYRYYDEYENNVIQSIFPKEKFEEINMFDLSLWEDCLLLHYSILTKLVHTEDGNIIAPQREKVVFIIKNKEIKAVLRYNFDRHSLIVYNAKGSMLSTTAFPTDTMIKEMYFFELPRQGTY